MIYFFKNKNSYLHRSAYLRVFTIYIFKYSTFLYKAYKTVNQELLIELDASKSSQLPIHDSLDFNPSQRDDVPGPLSKY